MTDSPLAQVVKQTSKGVSKAAKARSKNAAVAALAGKPGIIERIPEYPLRTDLVAPVLSFVVYGVPSPQGSKRYAGHRGGKPVLKEQSEGVDPWRESVRKMGVEAIRDWRKKNPDEEWVALDEPVMISAIVTMASTAAAEKRNDVFHEGTPDLDKLQRAIGDALAPRPLLPSDGKGLTGEAKRRVREGLMAQRRTQAVLHDDSRIVVWDRVMKVYPAKTPVSLGYSGVAIRVWRMNDLHRVSRAPSVRRGGRWMMKAKDLRTWAHPSSGVSWDQASAQAWNDPSAVLGASEHLVLRGRAVDDDGVRTTLRALALHGPEHYVEIMPPSTPSGSQG